MPLLLRGAVGERRDARRAETAGGTRPGEALRDAVAEERRPARKGARGNQRAEVPLQLPV